MTVASIDISNWTGRLSPQTAQCIADAGVRHCIVRASLETAEKGAIGVQQIQALHAVGIQCDVYLWCYFDWSPEGTVDGTVELLRDLNAIVRWFWLDVEQESDRVGRLPWEGWIERALVRCHDWGKLAGIYTGAWYWNDPAYLNGSTTFSAMGVPLWAAYYDKVPDINVWTPFGGWTFLHGKQYEGSGTARLCGIQPDLNTMSDLILPPVEPPPPVHDSITIAEAQTWVDDDLARAMAVHQQRMERLERAKQGEIWTP